MENFLMSVSMFFYRVQDKVSMTISLFVMAACIIGIVLVLFIASTKLKRISAVKAGRKFYKTYFKPSKKRNQI